MSIEWTYLEWSTGKFVLSLPATQLPLGEIVGVVGHNGAGKSTLLRLLAGHLAPTSGSVRVCGSEPGRESNVEPVRQQVGWMSDDMPLFDLTLGDHAAALAPFYQTYSLAEAKRLASLFELPWEARLKRLSKGENTRARLVLTLAQQPQVLLMDEPTTGLDPTQRQRLLAELLNVVADAKRTVVIASHSLSDIERVCDRVLWLEHGRLVANAAPSDVSGMNHTLEERLVQGARPAVLS